MKKRGGFSLFSPSTWSNPFSSTQQPPTVSTPGITDGEPKKEETSAVPGNPGGPPGSGAARRRKTRRGKKRGSKRSRTGKKSNRS